jgi:transmembrane sensor
MMKNLYDYSIEDFVGDESFRNWVLYDTDEERVKWDTIWDEHPEIRQKILLAKTFLTSLESNEIKTSELELDEITQKIIESDKATIVKSLWWQSTWLRIAASVLLVLGLFSYFMINNSSDVPSESVADFVQDSSEDLIETKNSSTSIRVISLEDGSKIDLYPNSTIKYKSPFDPDRRVVFLDGKAFFKVAENPKKPFWVNTDDFSTRVLGTSFLIDAFSANKNSSVQVSTGKVSVYLKEDLQPIKDDKNGLLPGIILTPNQQASFSDSENRLIKSIAEAPVLLSPAGQYSFVFDESPLIKVLDVLSKAYGITFTFDAKKIENCYLTANLEAESLYEKLDLICRVTHSTYEIVDAQVIIHSKGCH